MLPFFKYFSQISASFISPSNVGAQIIGNKGYITIEEPWRAGRGKNNDLIKIYNDKNEEKVSAMACGCNLSGLTKFAYNNEKEIYEFLSKI